VESGEQKLEFRATDHAGHTAKRSTTIQIDVEPPVAPEVQWLDLGEGRVYADWSHAPPFDAHSGISSITIEGTTRADGAPMWTESVPVGDDGNTLVLAPGTYFLRVSVADEVGHVAATSWNEVEVEYDEIALDSNGTTEASSVSGGLRLAPDPEIPNTREVRFFVDGRLRAATAQAPFHYWLDTESLEDGEHVATIVAFDEDGRSHVQSWQLDVQNEYETVLRSHLGVYALAAITVIGSAYMAFKVRRSWNEVSP
jgi:hypothetical protein